MKIKLFLTAIGSFAITMAYSQIGSDQKFSEWDANDNNRIEKNEYKVNANVIEKWDENGDNKLSLQEVQDKVYELVDANSDNQIDSIEWQQAQLMVNSKKAGNTEVKMNEWDANSDMKVSKEEFNQKLVSVFNKWDDNKDNALSKTEFYNYSFGFMDLNNDGSIAENEFNKVQEMTKDNEHFWDGWFD